MTPPVLNYIHPHVINRYAKVHGKSLDYSTDVFKNLMKLLYLMDVCKKQDTLCIITESINELDNMWHIFLLFTRDYQEFCSTYFGEFLHHVPSTPDQQLSEEVRKINLKKYLELLVAEFGEELMNSWYKEKKYA